MMKNKLEKLTPRSENQAKWYQELVLKAELADYSPVRGCIVFRPYGYRIWELIQQNMDQLIKEAGVNNAYFPLFIPQSFIQKEKDHLEGFSPEVAVVTQAGGKELEEKLVIRPTSETMIYSMFSKWIHSYKDLPLRLNQWCNIVRWEKRTLPFLRTSEFLWQEGHTIHATKEEGENEVKRALEMYKKFMNEYLSLYVVTGRKTEAEKFAGANYTYTAEALMRDGKALQCGTSHLLDQSFAKAFDIKYVDQDGVEKLPWMTSWGSSTRMIGAVILAHGDDKGLVLPPRVAPIQIIIVPVSNDTSKNQVKDYIEQNLDLFKQYRVEVDWSDNTPGWKFSQWEMKGVPVRLEVGIKEAEQDIVTCVRRDTGVKETVKLSELNNYLENLMSSIQQNIFESHRKFTEENTFHVNSYDEFKKTIQEKKGFVCGYFDATKENEEQIKYETKATTRCVPSLEDKGKCFLTEEQDKPKTYFARAY